MDRMILEVNCEDNKVHLTRKLSSICKGSNENNKLHLSTGLNHSGSETNKENNNIHNESKLMIQDVFEKAQELSCDKSLFDLKNGNKLALTQDSHSIIDKSITRIFPCKQKSNAVIKKNITSKENQMHTRSIKLKPIEQIITESKRIPIQQELNCSLARLQEKETICKRQKQLIPILPKPVAAQTKPMEEQHNSMMLQTINSTQENILIDFGKMENFEKIFPVAIIHQSSDFQSIKLLDENIENKNEMFILGL